jgi:hypothetical protein
LGWKVFEAAGVEPVFPQKDQAIGYAETRACFGMEEICMLDSIGDVRSSCGQRDFILELLTFLQQTFGQIGVGT